MLPLLTFRLFLNEFPVVGLVKLSFMDVKKMILKNEKNLLKMGPSAGEYSGSCRNSFPNQFYETFMDIIYIFLLLFLIG